MTETMLFKDGKILTKSGSRSNSRAVFLDSMLVKDGKVAGLRPPGKTRSWVQMETLYVATIRRSSRKPTHPDIMNERFRLELCEAMMAATDGSARSIFAEERVGSLVVGKLADFVIVDMEWKAETLLQARVEETWFQGSKA